MIWDKTSKGEVAAFYNFGSVICDFSTYQASEKVQAAEVLRQNLISASRVGKNLVINCAETVPDFEDLDRRNFPSDLVFDFEEWRKRENFMKILKDNENYNNLIDKGKFD